LFASIAERHRWRQQWRHDEASTTTLYTAEQAAERMNITPRYVRRLIAERRIAFVRLGRHVRISEADIEAFLTAGRVEALLPAPRNWRGGAA
jgi:excisionase family DNA binding protein